jgi:hypothetical protein
MLAAKEGPYNVRNNVMDNDKENIICHWKAQSWGVNVQNDGRRLVLDESACRNADTLLCPVWEIARYLNAARETAKSGGPVPQIWSTLKSIKMLNLMAFTSGVRPLC